MELKPSEIRYSQDSINNVFDKRCSHPFRPIGETLDDLCEGRCSVSSIPRITVVMRNGHWTTEDNRRLWVFQQLERLGKCDTIPAYRGSSIPSAKLTSYDDGRSIRVRGSPGGYWHRRPSAARPTPQASTTPASTPSSLTRTTNRSIFGHLESSSRTESPANTLFETTTSVNNSSHLNTSRALFGYSGDRPAYIPSPSQTAAPSFSRNSGLQGLTTQRSFGTPGFGSHFVNSTEEHGVTYMNPHDLKYTKTHISNNFDNGRSISEMQNSIRFGFASTRSIPPLKVYKVYGNHYVMAGNRRLKVFKEVRQSVDPGLLVKVKVTDMEEDVDEFIDEIRERYSNLPLFDILRMGDSITVT